MIQIDNGAQICIDLVTINIFNIHTNFFIFTDRRYTNSNFLEKNLKYNYKIKKNITSGGCITFEKKYQPYP